MKDINGKIQYKGKEYTMVFNLNVMEEIQAEYGSIGAWADLTDKEEPDAKAVKFGIMQMINEGIDIDNEENGTNTPFFTMKQIGRLLTEVGMKNATTAMTDTVIASTKGEEKNG